MRPFCNTPGLLLPFVCYTETRHQQGFPPEIRLSRITLFMFHSGCVFGVDCLFIGKTVGFPLSAGSFFAS